MKKGRCTPSIISQLIWSKAGQELGGELAVAGGGGARGIVLVDGLAVAGGLGQANGAGNNCLKNLSS